MNLVDANVVLRYLLNDVEELADKAAVLLENKELFIPTEVIAEIVYILEKVYQVEREEIQNSLLELFSYNNIQVNDLEVIIEALKFYTEKKLDFVDAILYAYYKVRKYNVYTFDKKLSKLLGSQIPTI
ncbi:PIN domain-containing protein [Caldicoprobacter faecalis]|uniref:Predicted nucleic-acid-binding protein, contains PIN domain n=1 Tax=Caldicoprobacter faecalis TaxID=937334 RepID=A0A1I5WHS3_9FIRM|nr:PIN domain-containing protein [Caldicoprobacter faecalis]SFQ19189.1 Predicted nucleic-acid-binding protein, contains PIN domain [Caldicoprobacter faecalis]